MMDKLKNMFNKTKGNNKKELTHRELMEQEKKAATKAKKRGCSIRYSVTQTILRTVFSNSIGIMNSLSNY